MIKWKIPLQRALFSLQNLCALRLCEWQRMLSWTWSCRGIRLSPPCSTARAQVSAGGAQCQPCCDQPWLLPFSLLGTDLALLVGLGHPGGSGSPLHENQLCGVFPTPPGDLRALSIPAPVPLLTPWQSVVSDKWYLRRNSIRRMSFCCKVNTPQLWMLRAAKPRSLCPSVPLYVCGPK